MAKKFSLFDTITNEIPTLLYLLILFFVGVLFARIFSGSLFAEAMNFLSVTSPIWLPLALIGASYGAWMDYIKTKAFLGKDMILLEIRLPQEISQSPGAMEIALNAFFHTGEPMHLIDKYWNGAGNPQFSLEIASFEGEIHFFVRCRRKLKDIIEAHLYAHYPNIEIVEVDDYMDSFEFDLEKKDLFGLEYKLEKPDPIPIKTYITFGLDKEQKEEFKHDPIATLIENLGTLGKGEFAALQIVIRSHGASKRKKGTLFTKEDWRDEAKREQKAIYDQLKVYQSEQFGPVYRQATEDEKEILDAIGRNIAKKPFDTGMRTIYIKDKGAGPGNDAAKFATIFRSFQSHNLNNFKPLFVMGSTHSWHLAFGRKKKIQESFFNAFRRRCFFHAPHRRPYMVLSSEELATVFHLPGQVVQTPTLPRIPSRRADAPPNLPV